MKDKTITQLRLRATPEPVAPATDEEVERWRRSTAVTAHVTGALIARLDAEKAARLDLLEACEAAHESLRLDVDAGDYSAFRSDFDRIAAAIKKARGEP